MGKPPSEQLANLSVRAKNIEDTVAAAQKEAHRIDGNYPMPAFNNAVIEQNQCP
jgi:hypothetical protein